MLNIIAISQSWRFCTSFLTRKKCNLLMFSPKGILKGRISKRVFQKKQSTPYFPKKEHFLPPWHPHVRVCVRRRRRKCSFFGKYGVLCFLKHPFWDSPFCFIIDVFILCFENCFSLTHIQWWPQQFGFYWKVILFWCQFKRRIPWKILWIVFGHTTV